MDNSSPKAALLPPKKKNWRARIGIAVGILIAVLGIATLSIWAWYTVQLTPVDTNATEKVLIEISPGSSPSQIADTLQEAGLIRNDTAFLWYTRTAGIQNRLQAGVYRLSAAESTQSIATHLVNGRVDTFSITFFPGATLTDTTSTPAANKLDVTSVLKRAGYTDAEITAGFEAEYSEFDSTLFQDRPVGADLEGYVYGETYQFASTATVQDILRGTFNEFWAVIEENSLVDAYAAQGLSLYQGITLASIIQRESGGDDKAQIAQVFYLRYRSGMQLGSDVTYQYITDKLGVPRDISYDSPYNTRRYTGLPPGPIATPGLGSLQAVAQPAATDYLYFLSGDDNTTYFARTLEEHEANIANHCQLKCQII